MLININDIKINSGRREAAPEDVQRLSESIAEVGMMNPITVDADHTLVAGLHRLEAAKLLGWTEVECTVCELDGLHAELAEIDENVIRTGLSDLELSELLARRKRIYETLHPSTIARNLPGHASNYGSSGDKMELLTKSATSMTKCDKIEKKRGGGRDAAKGTHDNDRGFSASESLYAETGECDGSIFRL